MLKRKNPPEFQSSLRAAQQRAKRLVMGVQQESDTPTFEVPAYGLTTTSPSGGISTADSAKPPTQEPADRTDSADLAFTAGGTKGDGSTNGYEGTSLDCYKHDVPLLTDSITHGSPLDPNISMLLSTGRPMESENTENFAGISSASFYEPKTNNHHPVDAVVDSSLPSKSCSLQLSGHGNLPSHETLLVAADALSLAVDESKETELDKSPCHGLLGGMPEEPDFSALLAPEAISISIDDLPPFPDPAANRDELAALEAEVETLRASEERHKRTIQHLKQKLEYGGPRQVAELQELRRRVRQLSEAAKAHKAERVEDVEEMRRLNDRVQELVDDLTEEYKKVVTLKGEIQRCNLARGRAERAQEEALRDGRAVRNAVWNLLNIEGVEGIVSTGFGEVGKALMTLMEVVERVDSGAGRF